jgi:transposase
MGKKKRYNNDFKVLLVELLESGRTAKELSEKYNINSEIIRNWKREFKAKSEDFTKKSVLSSEELELKALKKELRNVTIERDILKKAVSIFSKSDQ